MDSPRLPNYQLGEVIGRGGFGVVHKALNWTTGETVAIKQIGLSNIPKSELPDLMSEINLLKNLDHPNIVQYRGSTQTADFLYIILEYCENGSLHTIAKRFGKFPESLVAQYICQVLDGLLYLHDQGVIHRDIKGSNILATKEGSVKLADFGVATQAGPLRDSAVVGSPYWMAPEVIDQSGATTASDIWSVGAVVIELIDGSPPYAELDPMPALFRIVNDDCPPLPDSASSMCRDFLLQCFQKDCNLRISANKLLRHPWMMAARRQLDQTRKEQLPRSSTASRPLSAYDQTVSKVQEWNKALEAQSQVPATSRLVSRPSEEVAQALQGKTAKILPAKEYDGNDTVKARKDTVKAGDNNQLPVALPLSALKPSMLTKQSEEGARVADSNWDQDFEEGIPSQKLAALDVVEDAQTLTKRKEKVKKAKRNVEDWSDLVDDQEAFVGRVANLRLSSNRTSRILHPRDLSGTAGGSGRLVSRTIRPPLPTSQSLPNFNGNCATLKPPSKAVIAKHKSGSIARYAEIAEEEDDFSVLLSAAEMTETKGFSALRLVDRFSAKSGFKDELEEDDPFAEVEAESDSLMNADGFKDDVHRDQLARLNVLVTKLVESMSSSKHTDYDVTELCLQVLDHVDDDNEMQRLFVKEHGHLALLEGLQFRKSKECIASMLRILNIVISEDPASLEKLCLLGGCPLIMSFASNKHPRDIRLESALFIGAACRTSLLTLQMFISCRGLKVLVEMMDESYREHKDLVWMAIDCILRVFEMQGSAPRNEFCRLLAQEGLLAPLASALLHSAKDDDDLAESAKAKAVQILLLFAQSDLKVRDAMASRCFYGTVLVRTIHLLDTDLLVALLKTIKNISMSPRSLDILQNANAIEVLVRCLLDHLHGPLQTEVSSPIVNALYNLCKLSKSRQEEAASFGAVPALMDLVHSNSPLKQFALPLLCDFAACSKKVRKVLWQHDGLKFYLRLLKDPFWGSTALDSIATWLADDLQRIEDALLQSASIQAILSAFGKAKSINFENLLDPLLKILRLSSACTLALAAQTSFLNRLIETLTSQSKPVIRLNLLRIIKTMSDCLSAAARRKLVRTPHLMTTIRNLAANDSALLVRQLAKTLETIDKDLPLSGQPNMKRSNTSSGVSNLARKLVGVDTLNKLQMATESSLRMQKSSK